MTGQVKISFQYSEMTSSFNINIRILITALPSNRSAASFTEKVRLA